MKNVCLYIVAFLISVENVISQVQRLTIDDGLSQNFIYDVFQDNRGFIWVGTKDGLNRYDGNNVVIYRHDPFDSLSISDNNISKIFEDRNGVLWLGTVGGGLNRFDRATERFTHYSTIINDTFSLSYYNFTSMYDGGHQSLWIGTNEGLLKFDKGTGASEFFPPQQYDSLNLKGQNIAQVFEEQEGVLWLTASESGLVRIDLREQPVRQQLISRKSKIGEEKFGRKFQFDEQTKMLYSSTSMSIVELNTTNNTFRTLANVEEESKTFIGEIVREDEKYLYFNNSLSLFELDLQSHTKRTIVSIQGGQFGVTLFQDKSGILWFASNGLGVYKYNLRAERFHHTEGTFLTRVYEKEIVACRHQGMNLDLFLSGHAAWFPPMLKDSKGSFWIEYGGAIQRMDSSLTHIKKLVTPVIDNNTSSLGVADMYFEDRDGNIWIGTSRGIGFFDTQDSFHYINLYPAEELFNRTGMTMLGYQDITCIFQDKNRTFWLGTPVLGLIQFVPSTKEIRYYQQQRSNPKSLSNNHILSICEDPDGDENILWIGTDGGGLNRFDKTTGECEHFTEKNGMPNNVVYAVLSDSTGNLWMSTNNGICKFNPRNNSFRTYDVSDGLQSNEFNRREYFKSHSGELYFGGVNGYNHFFPEVIQDNQHKPNIEFTDFKLFNRSVSFLQQNSPLKRAIGETDSIILEYSQNMFTLEFSALDFSSPAKNQYAYMLEGFDEKWNDVGSVRSATYTNIDPGEYVFRVKASNSDGVWNEQGVAMTILILPPYWATWWFRGIGILLFLTIGPIVYSRRVQQLKREHRQQQKFSQQLIESQEQERKRIANELHDGVGQELLLIRNKLLLASDSVEQGKVNVQHLQDATQFSSKAIEEVRAISHNLRPSNLDQLGLTMAMESAVESVAESSNIKFSMKVENIDGLVASENEINVYRIVQEALNNIIKHSQATEVSVEVHQERDSILLKIEDNGVGISADVSTRSEKKERFGISGMYERANGISGTLTILPRETGGTIVQLIIPKNSTYANS
ncbi:MAG: hypothetical protein KGZ58_12090 [Ignavibacteriales bacterium]|nr:hypothetical protein [Ignavibacteriales bacterium]